MALAERHELTITEAGWYSDPDREHHLRYHDGKAWTDFVTHNGPTPCTGCWFDPTGH